MEGDPNDGTELEVYPYIKTIDREDFGVVYLAGSKWRHFRLGFSGSLTAMWRASDTSILVEIAWSIAEALVAAGAASFEVEAFLVHRRQLHQLDQRHFDGGHAGLRPVQVAVGDPARMTSRHYTAVIGRSVSP